MLGMSMYMYVTEYRHLKTMWTINIKFMFESTTTGDSLPTNKDLK